MPAGKCRIDNFDAVLKRDRKKLSLPLFFAQNPENQCNSFDFAEHIEYLSKI